MKDRGNWWPGCLLAQQRRGLGAALRPRGFREWGLWSVPGSPGGRRAAEGAGAPRWLPGQEEGRGAASHRQRRAREASTSPSFSGAL